MNFQLNEMDRTLQIVCYHEHIINESQRQRMTQE